MNPLAPTSFELKFEDLSVDSMKILLSGFFDEKVRIDYEMVKPNLKKLILDFSDLRLMNSFGIKTWVNFISYLDGQTSLSVHFENCKKQVIYSLNTVEGFLPFNGQVDSFYVPVHCPECDHSEELLQRTDRLNSVDEEELTQMFEGQACRQPDCNGKVELDTGGTRFFKFLSKKPVPGDDW